MSPLSSFNITSKGQRSKLQGLDTKCKNWFQLKAIEWPAWVYTLSSVRRYFANVSKRESVFTCVDRLFRFQSIFVSHRPPSTVDLQFCFQLSLYVKALMSKPLQSVSCIFVLYVSSCLICSLLSSFCLFSLPLIPAIRHNHFTMSSACRSSARCFI